MMERYDGYTGPQKYQRDRNLKKNDNNNKRADFFPFFLRMRFKYEAKVSDRNPQN